MNLKSELSPIISNGGGIKHTKLQKRKYGGLLTSNILNREEKCCSSHWAHLQYDLEKCLLPTIDISENLEKLLSMKHEL